MGARNRAWAKGDLSDKDIFEEDEEGTSKKAVGTKEFAQCVIANLGQKPSLLKSVSYANNLALNLPKYKRKEPKNKKLEGVDLFVNWGGLDPNELAQKVQKLESKGMKLTMITNRGIKVWPDGFKETFCTDHWRCRFKPKDGEQMYKSDIIELLEQAIEEDIDTIKTENLYAFDGVAAYSLGQGQ
jgi:isocitrate dehydrogenase